MYKCSAVKVRSLPLIAAFLLVANIDALAANVVVSSTTPGEASIVNRNARPDTYLLQGDNGGSQVKNEPITSATAWIVGGFNFNQRGASVNYTATIRNVTPGQYVPAMFDAKLELANSLITTTAGYNFTRAQADLVFDSGTTTSRIGDSAVSAQISSKQEFNGEGDQSWVSTSAAYVVARDSFEGSLDSWITMDNGKAFLSARPFSLGNESWEEISAADTGLRSSSIVKGRFMALADNFGVARFTIRLSAIVETNSGTADSGTGIVTAYADPHVFISPDYLAINPNAQLSVETGWSNVSAVPEPSSLILLVGGGIFLIFWQARSKRARLTSKVTCAPC